PPHPAPAAASEPEPHPGSTPAPAPGPAPDALTIARELFTQGNTLRQGDDCEQALVFYLKSRAVAANAPATMNAGYCLDQLGRPDEALEMYESVLVGFSEKLTSEQRKLIGPVMQALRAKVGELDLVANVDGILVVDGRHRATLPLLAPLHVLPGKHRIQVQKAGFAPFSTEVVVAAGDTARVSARLTPLVASGLVVVEAPGAAGASLYVDGALVGALPFSGRLSPGKHTVWTERGDEGSAPDEITVMEGQTVRLTPALEPLGPTTRITADPPNATIRIDRVPTPASRWQGRLPTGTYVIEITADGHFPAKRTIEITATGSGSFDVGLRANREDPFWSRGKPVDIDEAATRLAKDVASGYEPLRSGSLGRLAVLRFDEIGDTARQNELGWVAAELVGTRLVANHRIPLAAEGHAARAPVGAAPAGLDALEPRQASELATKLGAQGVIAGSISETGGDFVILVRLLDLRTGTVVASSSARVRRGALVALAEDAIVRRTRSGAIYRSFLPGWGQFYNGKPHQAKGYVVAFGALAAGAATGVGAALARHWDNVRFDYESGEPVPAGEGYCLSNRSLDAVAYDYCAERREHAETLRDHYQVMAIASGGVLGAFWLYGIVDAAIHGEDYEGVEFDAASRRERTGPGRRAFVATPMFDPRRGDPVGVQGRWAIRF
ncbi:MAG: hypothetical protein JW751_11780, partial [Polyangiaceae bacterium]|nr:hypothetical protein [Polyangiaceae bacterium]